MKLVGSSNLPLEDLEGSSKVVILGSGFGTTAEVWDLAQKHFNPEMKYLRFDLPGHGLSPAVNETFSIQNIADAVIALADSLNINKFCYAGVSIGGAIGLTLALKYPHRVKVVLPICSAPKFGDSASWITRAAQVRENGTAQFVEGTRDRWFSKRTQERKPDLVEQTLQMLTNVDRESYALGCEALAKYDIRNELQEIKIPVMVIAGELDPVVPYATALEYSQQLGEGSIIEVLGVAHQAVLESPEVLAKHINYSVRQHK
jgi:3-oxoadipate enol-lactonase